MIDQQAKHIGRRFVYEHVYFPVMHVYVTNLWRVRWKTRRVRGVRVSCGEVQVRVWLGCWRRKADEGVEVHIMHGA